MMAQSTMDKDYREVLKKRMKLSFAMIILGAITLILSILFSNGKYDYLSDFLSGIYTGLGSGLIAGGLVRLIKMKIILKDEKKLKQKKLVEQDERNQMIKQKSMYSAASVLIILAYLGLLVSGIFNLTVFFTLWVVTMVYLAVFFVMNVYYSKKF